MIKDNDKFTKDTSLRIIEMLIKAGANLNAQNNQGKTALMFDIDEYTLNDTRTAKILNLLVKAGADVNIKDKQGKTVLMYVADMMYDNASYKTIHNYVEFHSEILRGDVLQMQIPSARLDSFLDNTQNEITKGYNTLANNLRVIKTMMINTLLSAEANIHDTDNKGETPLSLAKHSHSDSDIIKSLR